MSVCVAGEFPRSAPSTVKLGMSLCVSISRADLVIAFTCDSIFRSSGVRVNATEERRSSAKPTLSIPYRIQSGTEHHGRTDFRQTDDSGSVRRITGYCLPGFRWLEGL